MNRILEKILRDEIHRNFRSDRVKIVQCCNSTANKNKKKKLSNSTANIEHPCIVVRGYSREQLPAVPTPSFTTRLGIKLVPAGRGRGSPVGHPTGACRELFGSAYHVRLRISRQSNVTTNRTVYLTVSKRPFVLAWTGSKTGTQFVVCACKY